MGDLLLLLFKGTHGNVHASQLFFRRFSPCNCCGELSLESSNGIVLRRCLVRNYHLELSADGRAD